MKTYIPGLFKAQSIRKSSSDDIGPRHHSQPLLQQKPRPLLTRQQTQPAQFPSKEPAQAMTKYATTIPIESDDDFEIDDVIEKQMIQRRRRIFSQHRQYQQWRKKQFSYDSYTTRAVVGAGAAARRRLYKRQFSCMERSGGRSGDSSDSRDSKYNYGNNSGNTTKRNSVNSVSVLIASLTMVVVL